MNHLLSRRRFIQGGSAAACGSSCFVPSAKALERSDRDRGYVVGEPSAESVGNRILDDGGTAIDAIVAAAFTAAVAAPNQTGIGGYGMSAIFAIDDGRRIVAIDGNSMAPAAMRADTFKSIADGTDKSRANEFGWLAVGVPGILAGLQLAIDRFGTRTFRELVQPAIDLAKRGYPWSKQLATMVAGNKFLEEDAGSRKLYFRNGQPLKAGDAFTNPELAALLETLAKANSVRAFYHGDIAQRIAEAFQKNGGLVTAQDLASYEAKLVEPMSMSWNDCSVYTPPLTAGGMTVLQILQTLKAIKWNKISDAEKRLHAKIESTRLAWNDRLSLLGDPSFATVPMEHLLSDEYAEQSAARIADTIAKKTYIPFPVASKTQGGTINLSAADRFGNMAALTLTHGESFGAKVTVEGLGLTLGHGMSRFDPRPDHPNSPGPAKRPLHNMVPTIVTRAGRSVLAIGGRGGRKIINAIVDTLLPFVANGESLEKSIATPRLHTEGDNKLQFESRWHSNQVQAMKNIGYEVTTSSSATLSAVALENGKFQTAMR